MVCQGSDQLRGIMIAPAPRNPPSPRAARTNPAPVSHAVIYDCILGLIISIWCILLLRNTPYFEERPLSSVWEILGHQEAGVKGFTYVHWEGEKIAVLETTGRDRSRGGSVSIKGRMTSNVINTRYSPPKDWLCSHFSGRSLMNSIQIIFHVLQVEATLIDGNEGSPQLMMWILWRIKNSFFRRTYWNTCCYTKE